MVRSVRLTLREGVKGLGTRDTVHSSYGRYKTEGRPQEGARNENAFAAPRFSHHLTVFVFIVFPFICAVSLTRRTGVNKTSDIFKDTALKLESVNQCVTVSVI